ncbi:DoxX family protein [Actinoplanes sp. NBC_00393]|uniref:DoxX family membrane protein n=1 Tax=Actinoplanes sp. NBC_00393 TaxID=2975953 RepID=UPI002E2121AE
MSVTELTRPATVPAPPVPSVPRTWQDRAAAIFTAYGAVALRVSLGLVLLGFGALKFFPGASPAEALVMRTVDALTFGLISGTPAVVATAVVETFIGFTLITGIGLRVGALLLFPVIAGMMTPLFLFPADMFPGMLPTLEAQYILKDIILAAAAMVVAGRALASKP